MKVAFDEEISSSDVEKLRKCLLELRHPPSVIQTFAFTHSHFLLQPHLHSKTKEKNASLKYDIYFILCALCIFLSVLCGSKLLQSATNIRCCVLGS